MFVSSTSALGKAMPSGSAVIATALGTTELLEAILIRLDLRTLLLSQRVSQTFRDVIKGSVHLQKKLFFVPCVTNEEATALCMPSDDSLVISDGENESMWVINELTLKEGLRFRYGWSLQDGILPYTISARRSKGSWERMYLTQPPFRPSYIVGDLAGLLDKDVAADYHRQMQESASHAADVGGMYTHEPNFGCDMMDEGGKTLREVMDEAEEVALNERGYDIDWSYIEIKLETYRSDLMLYSDYKWRLEHRYVEKQETRSGRR